ncbi:MAG: branched-chain amino acid ABC transporter permease [Actinomycetota bacterium]|nr:branched-chain amino acid ABC transporter permease [Actinomycetota bacterium]
MSRTTERADVRSTDGPPPPRAATRRTLPMWGGLAVLLALTLVLTQANLVLTRYQLDIATTLLTFIALAQAWNILAGYSGQFSLGASAFVGTGAYATGLVQIHLGVSFPIALVVAAVCGGLLAALLAWPLLRLRGDYFSIGTLAAALALQAWMFNWEFAGGSTGISLPINAVPGPVPVFRVACILAGLAMATAYWVSRSTFGLRLKAVRDHESAATGLGVSAFHHRLAALLVSGVLMGLVGGVVALQQVSFEPAGMLGIEWTINALLMTIVGGIGTVIGPAVGAVVVYYLLTKQLAGYQSLSIVIEGILLIAIVRFAPKGLWPLLVAGVHRLTRTRKNDNEGTAHGDV